MVQLLEIINEIVWGIPTLLLILGVGLYFTVKTRFFQFVKFPSALKTFFEKLRKSTPKGAFSIGASVLIGLFKKRCHTNGFSDFRVADFLVFTLQAVTEMPKSKPTS